MEAKPVEVDHLLEAIHLQYGYDFSGYAPGSLIRRIKRAMLEESVRTFSEFRDELIQNPECMERFLGCLSVHATSMFRDPRFYRAIRAKAIPILRTYPFVRIWIAGCSTGEEVYSLAVILTEAGIYDRCRIYATDMSDSVLRRAREGIFPIRSMREYTRNYQAADGARDFSTYYTARYEHAIFKRELVANVTFAQHNLTINGWFNEFNLILCRNVMIYFSRALQEKVFRLFDKSLCRLGILGLGRKETLRFTRLEDSYEEMEELQRLYRRLR